MSGYRTRQTNGGTEGAHLPMLGVGGGDLRLMSEKGR